IFRSRFLTNGIAARRKNYRTPFHSPLGQSCLAQAIGDPLPLREAGRMVRRGADMKLRNAEIGVEGKPGQRPSPGGLDATEMGQRRSEKEMHERSNVPVGLDRSLEPVNGRLIRAEI